MGKHETITTDLRPEVYADVQAAVDAGEFESVADAVAWVMDDWAIQRRAEAEPMTPEMLDHVRRKIEESRADPRPGIPAEELFAELRARYATQG